MCAAIGMRYGQEVVEELAIEEWRGASPISGDRLRKIMAIHGDGVEAILKVLQLVPGFPQHYLDVRYEIVDDHHGYSDLRSCGAPLALAPSGSRATAARCHTIQDANSDPPPQVQNPPPPHHQ